MIKKAVIPVAGKGTRFLPITKGISKEMLPIVDVPVLLLVLKECADSGIKEVLLITRRGKNDISKFFSNDKKLNKELQEKGKFQLLEDLNYVLNKLKISFVYQRKNLIGTAGAVYVAKKWVNNEPFAVLYGDDINYTGNKTPALKQLIDCYNKYNKMVLGCKEVEDKEVCKYGAVKIIENLDNETFKVNCVVEKPKSGTQPSNVVSLARYIMPANTFYYIQQQLKKHKDSKVEVCLTDTMDMIMKNEGYAIAKIMDSIRYDTGDKFGYLTTVVDYALRDKFIGEKFKNYLKNLKL